MTESDMGELLFLYIAMHFKSFTIMHVIHEYVPAKMVVDAKSAREVHRAIS